MQMALSLNPNYGMQAFVDKVQSMRKNERNLDIWPVQNRDGQEASNREVFIASVP